MRFDSKYKPELCASKDLTRENLLFVELDVKEQALLATDGHRLIKVPCIPEDGDVTGPVTADALKAARKAAKVRRSAFADLKANGALTLPDGTSLPRPGSRQFPPWQEAIPRTEGRRQIAFNAKYLKEIADALGSDDGIVVLSIGEDARDPLLVYAFGENQLAADGPLDPFAVLMPCGLKQKK